MVNWFCGRCFREHGPLDCPYQPPPGHQCPGTVRCSHSKDEVDQMWAYVAAVGGQVIKVPALGLKGGKVLSFRTWKPEDPKRCPMCQRVGVAGDFEETQVG